MSLRPLKNSIAFTFVDRVNAKGEFEKDRTESGLYLRSTFDDSAKQPRWVNVSAVGPDCKVIKEGDQVLLPNLRWTSHFKYEDAKVWRSDEGEAVAVRNGNEVEALSNVVIFKLNPKETIRSTGLLFVVGGTSDDTPSGTVIKVGPKVDGIKPGQILYFNDTNFTDTFSFGGIELSFIKDENILVVDDNGV